MCPKHYKAWKKYGDPDGKAEPRKRVVGVEPCSIDGCDRPQSGRGWCGMHNYRRRTYGAADHRFGWEVRGGCKVCPRCGVDKPLSDYSPAASVDHIIPLSRGGTHEPGNAQCSHLRCNVAKGARID